MDDALAPPRRGLAHREPQPVARPAEVEPRLDLDHHRQPLRRADGADLGELPHEGADGELDAAARGHGGGAGAARDDDDVGLEGERVRPLAHLHPAPHRPPHELARHAAGIGDPVLPARHRADDVVRPQAVHPGRIDPLHRDAEPALRLEAPLELGGAVRRRRQEDVADRVEERRAELAEQRQARLRELHLRRRRELLPDASHRLPGGAAGDLAGVGEDDAARAAQGEVVRDGRPDRARARYDDSSQRSSSSRSAGRSPRSGARTSSRIGTPRRPPARASPPRRGTPPRAPTRRPPRHARAPPARAPPRRRTCLLYTSPSPRDRQKSRMPSSA